MSRGCPSICSSTRTVDGRWEDAAMKGALGIMVMVIVFTATVALAQMGGGVMGHQTGQRRQSGTIGSQPSPRDDDRPDGRHDAPDGRDGTGPRQDDVDVDRHVGDDDRSVSDHEGDI